MGEIWCKVGGGEHAERDELRGGRHRPPQVDGAREGALVVPHQAVAHGRGEQLLHQHVQVLGGAERTW